MNLRRDFKLAFALLLLMNALLALGAISLFVRMSPVIEKILADNVNSIEAAEDALVLLAKAEGAPLQEAERDRLRASLLKAKISVTERGEKEILRDLDRLLKDTQSTATSPEEIVELLGRLISVNRRAMMRINQEAQRLGNTGAWSVVFLALISFAFSLLLMRRAENYILKPLVEVNNTLDAFRAGDRFRRCYMPEAPSDIRRMLEGINELIDTVRQNQSEDAQASSNVI